MASAPDDLLRRALQLEAAVMGAPVKGGASARAVLVDARKARHAEAAVVALRSLGHAGRLLGTYDEATRSLDDAARTARRHHLDARLAEVLITRAAVRLEQGRTRAAARDLATARAAVTNGATASGLELEFLQGRLEEEIGRLGDAAASYRRALQQTTGAAPELRLKVLNNLAILEGSMGRTVEAEQLLLDGLAIAGALGPAAEGLLTHNLAWLALQRGSVVDALHRFDAAESLLEAGGFPLAEHELDRLEALLTMRLAAEGRALAERVVASLRASGNGLALAQALLKQAHLLLLLDEPAGAAASADEARRRFLRQRRRAWAARAGIAAVQARLAAGAASRADGARCEEAIALLEEAGFGQEAADVWLVLAQVRLAIGDEAGAVAALEHIARFPSGPLPQRLRGWVAAALLAARRGDHAGAGRAAERGLRELEAYRAALGSAELRALASGHGVELAQLGLAAAIASGRSGRVFAWIERGKVRSLLTPTPPQSDPVIAGALADLRALQQRAADETEDHERIDADRRRLEERIRRRSLLTPGAGAGLARPVEGGALRACLGERVLVEMGVHEGCLTAVVVSRRGMRRRPQGALDTAAGELGFLLASLRRLGLARSSPAAAARARAGADAALARLDDLLLVPLRLDPTSSAPVVICPPAALLAVPWGSLPSLRGRAVAVSPAAGMWFAAEQRAATRPRRSGRVAVVGGPRLATAPAEVAAVAALYDAPLVLAPPRATVAATLAALDGSAVAHLACHATFRKDNPMFSALELADGSLVVHDIERLQRPPALLILAGCDSGLSETYPGEELVGFLSVLLAAGTDTVIASIVPIPDLETAPLMTAFHRRLVAGERPASALATAAALASDGSPAAFLAATAFTCFGSG